MAAKLKRRDLKRTCSRPLLIVMACLILLMFYFMYVLHFFTDYSSSIAPTSTTTSFSSQVASATGSLLGRYNLASQPSSAEKSKLAGNIKPSQNLKVTAGTPNPPDRSKPVEELKSTEERKPQEVAPAQLPSFPEHEVEDDNLHLVFNTGCNLFQHWQAQTLMASALQVNQRGWITRIVSGCDYNDTSVSTAVWTHPHGLSDRMVPLEELKRSVFPRFRLHLTPVFEGAKEYPYLNKPQSLEHWVKHAEPKITQNVVAILDPDFIFVGPLTVNGEGEVLFSGRKEAGQHKVSKGHPVAQQYGIGTNWVKVAKQICGEASPCANVTVKEAEQHYQVGPPYLLHKDDFAQLMPLYTTYMKAYVALKGPGILSDMYAYTMAAAHLRLPHTMFDHFMVSCVDCGGEGWPWVDLEGHDACTHPFEVPDKHPVVLHYCHNYNDGDPNNPMFHKGHVPPNILDCGQPSIIPAFPSFQQIQTTLHNKRNAWMVCMIIPRINWALELYKTAYCKTKPDFSKRFRLIHSQHTHTCGKSEGETCWVYADKVAANWTWTRSKETNASFLGCFKDTAEERDLNHGPVYMSFDECRAQAKKNNARYFSMQAGGQCFWGDTYGRHGKSEKCTAPCLQSKGICGGYFANSVYKA